MKSLQQFRCNVLYLLTLNVVNVLTSSSIVLTGNAAVDIKKLMLSLVLNIKMSKNFLAGSLFCIGVMFGSLSAVFLMDAIGRKASLLAFSVMSLFIGWTLLMAASQAII